MHSPIFTHLKDLYTISRLRNLRTKWELCVWHLGKGAMHHINGYFAVHVIT